MSTSQPRILITGATGIIGTAIVRALTTKGVNLALQYHHSSSEAHALQAEVERGGGRAFAIAANLREQGQAAHLAHQALELMGGIDVLIHAAADFERTPLGTVTEAQWDHVFSLNLKSAFFLAQAVAKEMRDQGGTIIFLSDISARRPYGGYLPYCLAKAGIDALTTGLARALAPTITVNAVAPYVVTRPKGISDWEWNDLLEKTPMKRPSAPEEIATIVKMLSTKPGSMTGQIISVDGGRLIR